MPHKSMWSWKTDWLRLEARVRGVLRHVANDTVSEDRLRDALTEIDAILAAETLRGSEIPCGGLSPHHREIESAVWKATPGVPETLTL